MKKKLLVILTLTSLNATAFNYVVVVDKEKNNYEIIIHSEWSYVSNLCENDIEKSDIYYNYEREQKTTCILKEERTVQIGNEYKKEERETESTSKSAIKGTHKEEKCSDIVDTKYSEGSGYYELNRTTVQTRAYCNMEDGGWTVFLVPVNSQSDWKSVDWNQGTTPGMNLMSYSSLEAKCEEFGLPMFADYKESTSFYWEVARKFLKTETNYFSSHPTKSSTDGGGIALGIKKINGVWLTMKDTATSLPPLTENTDRGDYCNTGSLVCGFWEWHDYIPEYGWGAGAEDWNFASTEGLICGGNW